MEKIKKLRKIIDLLNLNGYLIPKNDEFFSEYTAEYDDNLKYISNFSGSAGFALIFKKKNYLFVDGRYTLQAEKQTKKKFNIATIPAKFPFHIFKKKKLNIGFDPKLHTNSTLTNIFKNTKCKLIPIKENLVKKIKKKTKKITPKKFFIIHDKNAGQSKSSKINIIVKLLNKKKIDMLFVTSSENIAWLLNLRGCDSEFSPIPNGYLMINNNKEITFYCDLKKIDKIVKKHLKNIKILDINLIEFFLNKIKNKKIQIDSASCSIYFDNILKRKNDTVTLYDPTYFLKAIKNTIEIKNTIKSHIYDGVALTKFILWLKNNFKKKIITELSAQEKALQIRKTNNSFKSLSFPTISAAGPNAAIIHYQAKKKSNRVLRKGELYLIDSGGQYNYGTTDVTRTISLDSKNERIKDIYTRVLKGHIAVANYKLNKNSTGSDIDVVARRYLKEIKLDYAHGTGHGVGYFLNVHEGPHAISNNNKIKLKAGMILSNEPGYYENNKFGIRIENLITIKKTKKKLGFVDLTMAPIEKSLINKKLLNIDEINWLNNYHSKVFKNIKEFMSKSELNELKIMCSNI